ncbi:MAG: 1-acyl-sn-glycerol-3-phosphate acyltransferase [Candidatus Nanopelagicales bacterium]|jgi:1-acyl-sn-glycerol-3-phosphate acyltransferase|nr:1-acyl-sn-glycerol-3-phosphate acyltransferase [Candidatus Nanopelagicales bacterium]
MADLVYPPVLLVGYGAFAALGLKVRVHGGEHLPRTGGAVLASNHVSYLDFIFAGYAARPSNRLVRFMAKDSVFRHRVAGPIMRSMHHIPVDREAGSASYAHAVDALGAGEVVGVFPEATMSRSLEPKSFKSGAVRMADEAGVPLVPMGLWGTQRLWCYDRRSSMKQFGIPVEIHVGEPVDASGDPERATARLRESIIDLVGRAQADYPQDGTGQWWQPVRLGGTAPEPGADD